MVAGFSLTGPKPGTISVESHDSINQEHRQIFPRAHMIVCQCRRLGCDARGLGPLPFGFLFDLTSSYTLAVLLFLALPALCIVAAYMARPPKKVLITAPG